jgi:multiple sugar transport system permease protein
MARRSTERSRPGIREDRGWRVAGHAGMVGVLVLYGFPLFWMVSTSMKSRQEVASITWLPGEVRLDAYDHFIAGDFLPALSNSLQICGLTVLITMALAIPAAFGLARSRSRLVVPLLLALLVAQMLPQSASFIPLFQLLNQLGLTDTKLGVALAEASLTVPFAILVLRPAFGGIPPALEEAAIVDGAASWRYLVSIAIPLARNTIFVVAAIVFVSAWGELVYPLTLLLDESNYPLSVYIAQAVGVFSSTENLLMALAAIASLPVLLVVLAAQKQLRRGLTLGGVK